MKLTELNAFFDFYDILMENRIEFVKKTYGDKLQSKIDSDPSVSGTADEFIDNVLEHDPSNKKIYTQWMIVHYLKGNMEPGYLEQLKDMFEKIEYNRFVKRLVGDINKYTPKNLIHSFLHIGRDYAPAWNDMSPKEKRTQVKTRGPADSDIIYNDNGIIVAMPKSVEAACHLGKGTTWCTATIDGDNMFDESYSDGNLYVIYDKNTKEKYQWHAPNSATRNDEVQDKNQTNVSPRDLMQSYPELAEAMPDVIDRYAKHDATPDQIVSELDEAWRNEHEDNGDDNYWGGDDEETYDDVFDMYEPAIDRIGIEHFLKYGDAPDDTEHSTFATAFWASLANLASHTDSVVFDRMLDEYRTGLESRHITRTLKNSLDKHLPDKMKELYMEASNFGTPAEYFKNHSTDDVTETIATAILRWCNNVISGGPVPLMDAIRDYLGNRVDQISGDRLYSTMHTTRNQDNRYIYSVTVSILEKLGANDALVEYRDSL